MRSQPAPHLRHDLLGEDLQLVEGEAVRHPRPMHRRDDVVDPEPPVQSDHLVGDFGRRPEEKPVLEQFVETAVEIVPCWHDLVLPPRSEERRVGKERRSRWSPYHYKKNE